MQSGNFLNGAFGRPGVACGSGYLEVLLSALEEISWVDVGTTVAPYISGAATGKEKVAVSL